MPAVLTADHEWPSSEEVQCAGMPDEMFAPGTSVYACAVEQVASHPKSIAKAIEVLAE